MSKKVKSVETISSKKVKSVETISAEIEYLNQQSMEGKIDQTGYDTEYAAITEGVDKATMEIVQYRISLATVLAGEEGAFESDMSKEVWLTRSDTALCRMFGVDWPSIPTFDPDNKTGLTKPENQRKLNRIRLMVQVCRKGRLIRKWGVNANGEPKNGNKDAYWSELKKEHVQIQAEIAAGTTEIIDNTRAAKRSKDQVFRDALAAWMAECSRTVVRPSEQTEAQRAGMGKGAELLKLLATVPASPTKA